MKVDIDAVLDQVATATGFDDFGDPSFRDGLEVFAEALATEANPNELGEAVADAQIRSALAARLRVEQWGATHPEVGAERIVANLIKTQMLPPCRTNTATPTPIDRDAAIEMHAAIFTPTGRPPGCVGY